MKVTKMEADAKKKRERERDWKRESGDKGEGKGYPLASSISPAYGFSAAAERGGGRLGGREEGGKERGILPAAISANQPDQLETLGRQLPHHDGSSEASLRTQWGPAGVTALLALCCASDVPGVLSLGITAGVGWLRTRTAT